MSYSIDGNDLETTYGVKVLSVSGAFDFLERKGETSYDWLDEDGEEAFTDASDIYFKSRTIYMNCLLVATSKSDFMTKLNAFKYLLESAGEHSLSLPYEASARQVYYKSGDTLETPRNWNTDKLVARFILKLVEPNPSRATSP